MTDQIIKYGWNFNFDKEITGSYYEKLDDLCSCAMCRNFDRNTPSLHIELREFLEQFGIDVAKPIEQWSNFANKDENIVDNVVYYAVNGIAKSNEEYEIDIGTTQIIVIPPNPNDVVHCPEFSPNTEIEHPYFVFQIYNLWLPWVVEDDINECYPEPKTYGQRLNSLLKRMKGVKT